jgi:hypothetical protein
MLPRSLTVYKNNPGERPALPASLEYQRQPGGRQQKGGNCADTQFSAGAPEASSDVGGGSCEATERLAHGAGRFKDVSVMPERLHATRGSDGGGGEAAPCLQMAYVGASPLPFKSPKDLTHNVTKVGRRKESTLPAPPPLSLCSPLPLHPPARHNLLSSHRLASPRMSSPRLASPRLASPRLSFSPLLSSPSSPLLPSPLLSHPSTSSPLLSSPRAVARSRVCRRARPRPQPVLVRAARGPAAAPPALHRAPARAPHHAGLGGELQVCAAGHLAVG